MCERAEPLAIRELQNNNQRGATVAVGDANANDVPTEDNGRTRNSAAGSGLGLRSDTSERDKVIIWGTDSQCDDPELAEFEMLECQELEAYLVEEGEDFVGLAERKEEQTQVLEQRNSSAQQAGERICQQVQSSTDTREASLAEVSSENEAFVTCQSSLLEDVPSQTCPSLSECSLRAGRPPQPTGSNQKDLDMNLNSTGHLKTVVSEGGGNVANSLTTVDDKYRNNILKSETEISGGGGCSEQGISSCREKSNEESGIKLDKSTQANETPGLIKPAKTDSKGTQSSVENKPLKKQGSFDNALRKQGSFERSFKKQPSFDNSPKKQGSVENTAAPRSSSLERRKPWGSPSRPAAPGSPKAASCSPKRRLSSSPAKVQNSRVASLDRSDSHHRSMSPTIPPASKGPQSSGIPKPVLEPKKFSPPQKPKNVRPKIITYVRKSTQPRPDDNNPHESSTNLSRASYSVHPAYTDPKAFPQSRSTPVLSSSNLLYDKYRQEMQKAGFFHPLSGGAAAKPPSSSALLRPGGKSASFHDEMSRKYLHESVPEEGGAVQRSPRTLRPQLGLGAVTRQPVAKSRLQQMSQKAAPGPCQPTPSGRASSAGSQDVSGDQRRSAPEATSKGVQYKPSQSGLRPPGFSALPASRLTAFGFSRSASVSSVSSGLSSDSSHSDPSRTPQPRGPGRTPRAQEVDRALIQQLQERCEQQALQLQSLQAQLKKAALCLDVFSITTQHFCRKSENAAVKERELSLELAKIRDEAAFNVARWEQLQQHKEDMEQRFEAELQELRARQQQELGALEERLKAEHLEETGRLRAHLRVELQELQCKQREQLEELAESHEASLMEMESTHNATMATLQEEHARTVKNLKMAHEQQQKSLEEEFEKIRLSLQDQVDTLTFQNRSLRDKAKRFEEALRKSTDEQIVDALAPYKHIEEDLRSLKEILEMKNQQIHQQEQKIAELEKIAEKNVYLEDKVQLLQQQNEDLRERIDKNMAMSRQLSVENANLQVHVEKESNEKKRLSRTNEELLWRLQTGELSPHMSPAGSPIHRAPSGPGSPARPHSYHQ